MNFKRVISYLFSNKDSVPNPLLTIEDVDNFKKSKYHIALCSYILNEIQFILLTIISRDVDKEKLNFYKGKLNALLDLYDLNFLKTNIVNEDIYLKYEFINDKIRSVLNEIEKITNKGED